MLLAGWLLPVRAFCNESLVELTIKLLDHGFLGKLNTLSKQ
jgi:hypothetical protein